VLFGLSDWEYTEVVEGVKEGEPVVLVTVAQILQQQEAFQQRIRERASSFSGGPSASPTPRGR
jgi:HlyD family secretion protein